MMWKPRLRSAVIVLAFVGLWLLLPFEWLNVQGRIYRKRADALAQRAAQFRGDEEKARSRGDLSGADQSRLEAERIERQGWIHRKASWREWQWPELKPGGSDR
jgi:hypothetical protein